MCEHQVQQSASIFELQDLSQQLYDLKATEFDKLLGFIKSEDSK